MPGAGKSHKLCELLRERGSFFFIDDFLKNIPSPSETDIKTHIKYKNLISCLRLGINCVITDIKFLFEEFRNDFKSFINADCQNINIEWICFENNPEACIKNIRERNRPNAEWEIKWIQNNEKVYTYPPAIELNDIIPIWTPAE